MQNEKYQKKLRCGARPARKQQSELQRQNREREREREESKRLEEELKETSTRAHIQKYCLI